MASGSSSIPFKAKKTLRSASKNQLQNPSAPGTPQEPRESLPSRARNRGVALSIKEVRSVAASLSQSNRDPSGTVTRSARKQILSAESFVQKSKVSVEADGSMELPEKYETLIEFFYALDSSILLSKTKRLVPVFDNIRPMVETLTKRRFTYRELSQLKYILPEEIELKITQYLDEKTGCVQPTLQITLNADAIEMKRKRESRCECLRKIFRTRLVDFIETHPEGEEVPSATLPHPFSHIQLDGNVKKITSSLETPLPAEISTGNGPNLQPAKAAHLPHPFQRLFSRKSATASAGKNSHGTAEFSVQSPAPLVQESISMVTPIKRNCNIASTPSPLVQESSSMETPIKESCDLESTPAKYASTPARLMAETPALCPPKRSYLSPKDDSESSPLKLTRRPPRNRTLKFDTPVKSERVEDKQANRLEGISYDDDVLGVLSESLLRSIKEKDMKRIEESDPAISLAKRRRKLIASLPRRFDTVRYLFQTSGRSFMTKEDLVNQIIRSCSDMIDQREVEEELQLLREFAPEWITEESKSWGDIIRLKRPSDVDAIRARLEEAKQESASEL